MFITFMTINPSDGSRQKIAINPAQVGMIKKESLQTKGDIKLATGENSTKETEVTVAVVQGLPIIIDAKYDFVKGRLK